MIGYSTLGSNDLKRAAAFYDSLLGDLGAKRMLDMERFILWTSQPGKAGLAVCKPYDGNAATVGNGTMVAINVDSTSKVDALYQKALALGGTDDGPNGPRGDGFYAGYFRDLDGNKLVVYTITA